jgi:hypothetical protein
MAFKLENLWISIGILVVIMTVGSRIFEEGLSRYNVVGDESAFGKVSTELRNVYDADLNMKDKITGGTVTDDDAVNQMTKGGYTAIRNNPFTITSTAINTTMVIAKESGMVDPIWNWVLGFILISLVVLSIIYLIFRFRVF